MNEASVKLICESIWDLEKRYDLLHQEIQGVKLWQLLRMPIYYEITKKLGVFSEPHMNQIKSKPKAQRFVERLLTSVINNPLRGSYHKEYLIFDHKRKVQVDGNYADIYTKYLLDEIDIDEVEVYEDRYLGQHFMKAKNRKYLDYVNFSVSIMKRFSSVHFTKQELIWIQELDRELRNKFQINLNLKLLFTTSILEFKLQFKIYDRLIKKRQPQKIFVVVSYSKGAIIAAAKANKVPVIEIQHGTISSYHLGYSFPNNEKELDYFPDIFYTFGEYWPEVVKLPIKKENVFIYGFPYLTNRMKKFVSYQKKKNQVLFISQGVNGNQLSNIAYLFAKGKKDLRIIFKLHPSEYPRWRKEYPELVAAEALENFEVVDHNKTDLYQYFAESEYQVGVFSTAIFEGLTFNCKTILYYLPGIEYMQYLQEKGIIMIVNNLQELIESLASFQPTLFNRGYFFNN
jgi:hypothetical protein